jgi:hypothetical protein
MKSYSETDVFTEFDKNELAIAIKIVGALPDPAPVGTRLFEKDPWPPGERHHWRCHEVTRAVAHLIGGELAVVDGQFAGAQHSWIAYREPESRAIRILDVYAVGRLPQVQLVDPSWSRGLGYSPGHLPRTDIDTDVIAFLVAEAEAKLGESD